MNRIVDNSEESLIRAGDIIRNGGLVVIPTETVYGLGANALDADACAGIFAAKKRPFFDPLISHISSLEMLETLIKPPSHFIIKLIERFWPGPLTVVARKTDSVPSIVTSGLSSAAVRFPAHPDARKIISYAGVPVAAPSANLFGHLSPTRAEHTLELGTEVELIVDGGPCSIGVESTIVREHEGQLYLLRPGGISKELIEEVSGQYLLIPDGNLIDAPGRLPSHYAPSSRVIIIEEGESVPAELAEKSCLLAFRNGRPEGHFRCSAVLSQSGSLVEAASNLFNALHLLDEHNPEVIYAEQTPQTGLGLAIMDRLKKAAAAAVSGFNCR